MKFLKGHTINKYRPRGQEFRVNSYGRTVMNGTGALLLPKGTTAQRPQTTNVRTPGGPNGYIRFNTDTNSVEAYINGVWETVRAPGASTVTKQTLGPGDYSTLIFGPLTQVPSQDDSVLVLVENVMQISVTNYSILYNYLGDGRAYIQFTEAPPLGKYITIYFGFAN